MRSDVYETWFYLPTVNCNSVYRIQSLLGQRQFLPQKTWKITKLHGLHKKDMPFWVLLVAGARKYCFQTKSYAETLKNFILDLNMWKNWEGKCNRISPEEHPHKHICCLQRGWRMSSQEQESFMTVNIAYIGTTQPFNERKVTSISKLSLSHANQ